MKMSLYGDFRRVWMERFPESDLPAAWEEDVRSNLVKHRQRMVVLKEELEKEEFYVSYLENLLADVEKQKTRAAGDGEAAAEDASCRTDSSESGIDTSETSRKFSKSCSQNSIDICISELADSAPHIERSITSPPAGSERSISIDESVKSFGDNLEVRPRSQTQPNLSKVSNFVTVIEINGKGKKKGDTAPPRYPPKPPPKTFSKLSSSLDYKKTVDREAPPSANGDGKAVELEPFHQIDPSQLLRDAAKSPSSAGSGPEIEKSVAKENLDSDSSAPSNFSKLIDRFSKPDLSMKNETDFPYGKIKRSGPTPTLPASTTDEPQSLEKATNNSVDSRRSNITNAFDGVNIEKGEETEEREDDVEYCTLMTPTSEEIPAIPGLTAEIVPKKTRQESICEITESEPYYDSVPPYDSDNECVESLTLPSHSLLTRPTVTPGNANYVNIDYFIKQRPNAAQRSSSVESEDEVAGVVESGEEASLLPELVSDGTYASNSSLESSATKLSGSELEAAEWQRKIIESIIQSEIVYIECLNVLLQYMKALKATLTTSQPVILEDELNTVFYKIPELHKMHSAFLEGLQDRPPYGRHFKTLADNLNDYGAFLHNYGHAIDTVKRRCQNSPQFAGISSEIKLKFLQNQVLSLEDLLHKPVARVQKNALVLDDLVKCPSSAADHEAFREALNLTKAFLDSFNMIETKKMFGHEDRAQRRLVKNSFMVELVEGHRKLRHLFLFNDVMACAKYKASGRDKFTFELKWYIHLNDLVVHEETGLEPKEINPPNLLALKSHACTLRDQILRDEEKRRSGLDKQRKKLADLEAQLVLAYPDLVLRVGQKGVVRLYCFLLSSEFERTQWVEAVTALQTISQQSQLPGPKSNVVSMGELQAWVTACRRFLKTDMGSYLLRSSHDESLLRGDLHVRLGHLTGLPHPADLYLVLEVDSYGHYFRKGRSKLICRSATPRWDQSFVIDLEGSQNLRILLYEEAQERSILRGKFTVEVRIIGNHSHYAAAVRLCLFKYLGQSRVVLNSTKQCERAIPFEVASHREASLLSLKWLGVMEVMRQVNLSSSVSLSIHLRFTATETSAKRVPQNKPLPFNRNIQQVCKREERSIPFLITSCVREVERRGMQEVGIYRVSGSSSDLTKLKKSFESNAYEAEQLLKEVCVHSVTGVMKLYLRELPEALFTDALYEKFLDAWNRGEERRGQALAACFAQLPSQNKEIINFLLDHLIRVNQEDEVNKMSLHNLATVFGPTLLRPSAKDARTRDPLMKGTVDVMAQAGILYHFLATRMAR